MTNDTITEANNGADGAPVSWFEIGTDDPARAREFYRAVFGWTFADEGPYTIITTGADHPLQGGIRDTGGPQPDGTPLTYAMPCVQVDDVAATCHDVIDKGGKVMVPATATPTGLVYAHVTDPSGNHIGLWTPPGG